MATERIPIIDRLIARVVEDANGCWIFTGAKRNGYGAVGPGGRRGPTAYAHRVTYEFLIAEIPEGLHIDHLCRVPACCNPWHLEPVTPAENTRRARTSNGPLTHCTRGHPFTPDNILQRSRQRLCRTCREASQARSYARYRAQRKAAA